jgi:hypothetical protein
MYTVERTDMTVFDLDRHVVGQYEKFARSFTEIQAKDILGSVDKANKGGRYWPEPMIQINPSFKPGMTVGELVRQGSLTAGMEKIFQAGSLDGTLKLHHAADPSGSRSAASPQPRRRDPSCHFPRSSPKTYVQT